MESLTCPRCRTPLELAGRTSRCPTCDGAWVSEEALVAILEQRASTLVALPWQPRTHEPRPCAACGAAMQTVSLGDVALDRCAQHGVWCDCDELTALLREAKQFKQDPKADPAEGFFHTLGRLLGR